MDCSLPGPSVRGISQARILEWLTIFSRGSSWPGDWTCVFCIGMWILYHWATLEALKLFYTSVKNQLAVFCIWFCFWSLSSCCATDDARTQFGDSVWCHAKSWWGLGMSWYQDTEMANIRKLYNLSALCDIFQICLSFWFFFFFFPKIVQEPATDLFNLTHK